MRDEYLDKLRQELEDNGFINIDEQVEKYRKRYDFGLESGLSEEEIEKRLGDPKEIVSKMTDDSANEYKEENALSGLKIEISTVSDDVRFEESFDNDTHLYMDDIDEESYTIINNSREIVVKSAAKKYFSLNRRRPGLFTIALPKDFKLGKMKLSSSSGDFISKIDLNTKNFSLNLVSGDADLKKVTTKDFSIHVVNGDAEIDEINAEEVSISSVSGDIDVDYILANNAKIDTVSGDITIKESSYQMNVKTNSISGKVMIAGKKYKTVSSKVKEVFKSES